MLDSESNKESIEKFPERYLKIEMSREAATIIMLFVIACCLVGGSWIEKGVFFPLDICFLGPVLLFVSLYFDKVATHVYNH